MKNGTPSEGTRGVCFGPCWAVSGGAAPMAHVHNEADTFVTFIDPETPEQVDAWLATMPVPPTGLLAVDFDDEDADG